MLAAVSALGWHLGPPVGPLRVAHPRSTAPRLQEEFNEADFDFSVFNDALLEEAGRLADIKAAQEADAQAAESASGWAALTERMVTPLDDDSRAARVAAARALADSREAIVTRAADGERRSIEEEDASDDFSKYLKGKESLFEEF